MGTEFRIWYLHYSGGIPPYEGFMIAPEEASVSEFLLCVIKAPKLLLWFSSVLLKIKFMYC